jgi:hypothetical protein
MLFKSVVIAGSSSCIRAMERLEFLACADAERYHDDIHIAGGMLDKFIINTST